MAKKNTFNVVNVVIWIILSIIICIGLVLLYNKTVFEKFEEEAAEKKKEDEPKKEEPVVEPPVEKKKPEMDKTEQSIFDKIVRNEMKTEDLQKLINAGVVTQNMVEKFLSKLDSKEEEKIEAFCGADDKYSPL
jgi:flagellar biosynthesis/type III secretory pathway M-ring protein FliF/YscJ